MYNNLHYIKNPTKNQLLTWLNTLLNTPQLQPSQQPLQHTSINKIQNLGTGIHYLHILNTLHPGILNNTKYNKNPTNEYEYLHNMKVLVGLFNKLGIEKHIEIQKIVKLKMQDNFGFLGWFYRFWWDGYARQVGNWNQASSKNYDCQNFQVNNGKQKSNFNGNANVNANPKKIKLKIPQKLNQVQPQKSHRLQKQPTNPNKAQNKTSTNNQLKIIKSNHSHPHLHSHTHPHIPPNQTQISDKLTQIQHILHHKKFQNNQKLQKIIQLLNITHTHTHMHSNQNNNANKDNPKKSNLKYQLQTPETNKNLAISTKYRQNSDRLEKQLYNGNSNVNGNGNGNGNGGIMDDDLDGQQNLLTQICVDKQKQNNNIDNNNNNINNQVSNQQQQQPVYIKCRRLQQKYEQYLKTSILKSNNIHSTGKVSQEQLISANLNNDQKSMTRQLQKKSILKQRSKSKKSRNSVKMSSSNNQIFQYQNNNNNNNISHHGYGQNKSQNYKNQQYNQVTHQHDANSIRLTDNSNLLQSDRKSVLSQTNLLPDSQ